MKSLGKHFLVEYYNCDPEVLKEPEFIEQEMNQAALLARATVVQSNFHHFSPWGVSGAVLIAESHLAIHTWPEYGFAAADFFTCGDLDPSKSIAHLGKVLKAEVSEAVEIERGVAAKIREHAKVDFIAMSHKVN